MIDTIPAATFLSTIMEALACGTPVVAMAMGGIPEQVKEGVTGYLTPPGDAEALAAQIVRLLQDDELRQEMGGQAAEDAKKSFDLRSRWKSIRGGMGRSLMNGSQITPPVPTLSRLPILEALACGTPGVATVVGGIPE